jgi:phosphatidylserine/phosphatidylglycerophosphate/cardiolipin synthase-like enzyme
VWKVQANLKIKLAVMLSLALLSPVASRAADGLNIPSSQSCGDIFVFASGGAAAPKSVPKPASFWQRWVKSSVIENGIYDLNEQDLQTYYSERPETKGIIRLDRPLGMDVSYRLTNENEFQAKNWYDYSLYLKRQQVRWVIDTDAFTAKEGASTFNEAKRKYFSQLPFNMKTFSHDSPYALLKEWGGLNHPPIDTVHGRDLSKFSKDYAFIDYRSETLDSSRYFNSDFHKDVDRVSESELTAGNRFRLINDGESLQIRLHLIENAKTSIWTSSLVFVDDASAQRIVTALIKRAQEGLDVRVILENSLRYIHPEQAKRMKEAGIQLVEADDFFHFNSQAIYHAKVMIVDQDRAIIGGLNMLDADLGSHGTDFKNRDLDVLVAGPVTTDICFNLMEDWNHFVTKTSVFALNKKQKAFTSEEIAAVESRRVLERTQGLRGAGNYQRWLGSRDQRMKGIARYVAQKPYKNISTITDAYLAYLDGVKTYLGFTNPQAIDTHTDKNEVRGWSPVFNSFKNFNRLFDKIQSVMRDKPEVHVDQITSGARFALNEAVPMTVDRIRGYDARGAFIRSNLNQLWMDKTNLYLAPTQYGNLIKDYLPYANTNVWIHMSFIHSKVFSFDRIATSIGSFNPHHNATDHAYESTLMIQDAGFNKEIDEAMVLDMSNSVPFVFSELKK